MTYRLDQGADVAFDAIIDDYEMDIPWNDRSAGRRRLVRALETHVSAELMADVDARLEILKPIFYRNKGAYWLVDLLRVMFTFRWW